jgi:hypothetical protein
VTLGSTAWQTIVSGAQIKLSSTTTFEKVIGSEFGDKITGNTLDNDIQGRGGNDQLVRQGWERQTRRRSRY